MKYVKTIIVATICSLAAFLVGYVTGNDISTNNKAFEAYKQFYSCVMYYEEIHPCEQELSNNLTAAINN